MLGWGLSSHLLTESHRGLNIPTLSNGSASLAQKADALQSSNELRIVQTCLQTLSQKPEFFSLFSDRSSQFAQLKGSLAGSAGAKSGKINPVLLNMCNTSNSDIVSESTRVTREQSRTSTELGFPSAENMTTSSLEEHKGEIANTKRSNGSQYSQST